MNRKNTFKIIFAAMVLVISFFAMGVSTFAEGKATVAVDSAYIRSSASTSGTIVAGVMKNDVLEIIESTTDSAGNTWYKVYVDASSTGYIRADLVTTSGDVPASSGSSTSTTEETKPAETTVTVTPVDPTPIMGPDLVEVVPVTGKTTGDVRVRKGPSTTTDAIDNVNSGTEVTVTAYEEASDGKWYYLTYGEKKGYIRSDFVSLDGELALPEEEAEPEEVVAEPEAEPEPEPTVYMDYEVVYELDGNGDTVYYLNDYIEGTRNPISELIGAKKELETTKANYEKALKKKKTTVVILSIIIVLLLGAGAAAFMVFRRWYYGYDETEEPVTVKKETKTVSTGHYNTRAASAASDNDFRMETVGSKNQAAKTSAPAQPKQTAGGGVLLPDGRIQMPDGSVKRAVVGVRQPDGSIKLSDGRVKMPDGSIVYPENTHTAASEHETIEVESPKSKARNFASEDDDMEFGFLNIDSGIDEE